jgi:predicted MFS family arabinose efflux permease
MKLRTERPAPFWSIVLACAALLATTTGLRLSLGLFVRPIAATGVGVAAISLVLAVGQFFWGAVQPLFGLLAERIGARQVLILGAILLGLGFALAPLFRSEIGLLLTLGVLSAAGAGAASFAVLMGAAAQRLPADRRALASGLINAGASFGQFLFAPLAQALITTWGWAIAMWGLAAAGFATIFLAHPAAGLSRVSGASAAAETKSSGAALRGAFRDRSYLCLHAGFFTCGFHIAFLVTHLPSEIALCGLPPTSAGVALGLIGLFNIAGSIAIGWLCGHYRMKTLLVELYAFRAILILAYLAAPKTLTTLYIFSGALGITWLATVPPTAGIVGRLFGTQHFSTLFGLTIFSHQIGAFFGAWLGGVAMSMTGSYQWVWYADAALAGVAALVSLPIREAEPRARVALAVRGN